MRLLVENSLISDPSGARARSVYLPPPNITVSSYFFWCFPYLQVGTTHNTRGSLWNNVNVPVTNTGTVSLVRSSPGRLYGAGGAELFNKAVTDPEVQLIARISVLGADSPDLNLGSTGCAANLREFINGKPDNGATPLIRYTTGQFVDTAFNKATKNTATWCWLLDSDGPYEVTGFGGSTTVLNQIVTKVVVVRVYDRDVYESVAPTNSFTGKPRVAESYVVFGGQVRI